MCTEVYNLFDDPDCKHREYQNTFACHIVRRCNENDNQTLKKTVFLPTNPPKVPPGLFDCKMRRATRPVAGKCPDCRRQQRLRTKQGYTSAETIWSSTSASSATISSSKSI
jgi:hypothetical protein